MATEAVPKKTMKTDDKQVAPAREPLWSRTGLIIMLVVWIGSFGLGGVLIYLFASAPSASTGAAPSDEGGGTGSRQFGYIKNVRVSLIDEDGSSRLVSFNLLLDFGEQYEESRRELEQGDFDKRISYEAEDLMRGYTLRQVNERRFAEEFGSQLKRRLNELYSKDGREYVKDILVQDLVPGS